MNERVAALEFSARCLGVEHHPDTIPALRSEMSSGHVSWESVVSVANEHLITPALWVALRDKELVECLPDDLREYLGELHRLNIQRNEGLRAQATEAIERLNAEGIEPILLKGAGQLFTDPFSDFGARMMLDLDILVPEESVAACTEALNALGYRGTTRATQSPTLDYLQHHHAEPLFRPGDYGTIELHRSPQYRTAARIMPAATAWANSTLLPVDGLAIRVLTPTYRILQTILHSEIVNQNYERGLIELRSLYDLASINSMHRQEVDWTEIRETMERHGKGKVLCAYVYLAHRWLGMETPYEIQTTRACVAHYRRVQFTLRWNWLARYTWLVFSPAYRRHVLHVLANHLLPVPKRSDGS